jgi:hypothetical protein
MPVHLTVVHADFEAGEAAHTEAGVDELGNEVFLEAANGWKCST